MTDTFNVTATFDKTSYNQGDLMTISISGSDVVTTSTVTQQTVNATVNVSNPADSATFSAAGGPVTINITTTTATTDSVVISNVTDGSTRAWTVAANGLSATATA